MDAPPGEVVSIAAMPEEPAAPEALGGQPQQAGDAGAAGVDAARVEPLAGQQQQDHGPAAAADAGADTVPPAAPAGPEPAAEAMEADEAAGEPGGAAEAHAQQPAATFSDQTLVQKPAAVASPTVQWKQTGGQWMAPGACSAHTLSAVTEAQNCMAGRLVALCKFNEHPFMLNSRGVRSGCAGHTPSTQFACSRT